MAGGTGRLTKYDENEVAPLEGSIGQIADALRTYAGMGLAEVQLIVDPITIESIRALAPVLTDLDRG
jgi:hypothetical protein